MFSSRDALNALFPFSLFLSKKDSQGNIHLYGTMKENDGR